MPPRRKTTKTSSTRNFSENASKSAEFFLFSIQDMHKLKYCGICLDGAFIESTATERAANLNNSTKSFQRDPAFWDAILVFLLIKRTDEELDALLTRLSDCSCQKEDAQIKGYHDKGSEWAEMSMARMHMEEGDAGRFSPGRCAFIIDLFCVLSTVLHNSGVTSVAKGTSRSWPIRPTDLIPNGADNLVENMLQWYRFVPDTIIFHVTGLVLRLCQALLIPSLIRYKFSHTVIQSCRQLVDITMADFAQDIDEEGRIRLVQRFQFRVSDYAAYLRNLQELNNTKPDCYSELMRGCETKAMQISSIFLYLSSDPKMSSHNISEVVDEFVMFGQILFRWFHMHLYPRPDMPVHPKVEKLDSATFPPPASLFRDPAQSALLAIHAFRTDRHCSAYKCTNSFQSAGKEFQRCARCKVVAYCGRECQTKAWKDLKFPHKQTCSVLRNLMALGGGSTLFYGEGAATYMAFPAILGNWKMAAIHEDDLLLIDDWNKLITESRGYPMPDGTEWTPGYDDYNEIIATLCAKGRGPKARLLNRLARWPSEVTKEERLLKNQPFWGEDIIC
ncbi:hypothetical protein BDN70DRAFT_992508 [Pholiota conissans]|uniref:MYND-type domain-containing protein n=1 Tax=Pholiota conissans TaxID=109636 RepID=A0A9P6D1S9_9AGAR|nr:hypothetical protein BDN70DRAFT_992508 [Pholiota conissans]